MLPMEEKMKNIVKAQFFQIVRDKIIKYMVVITLLMQVLMVMRMHLLLLWKWHQYRLE